MITGLSVHGQRIGGNRGGTLAERTVHLPVSGSPRGKGRAWRCRTGAEAVVDGRHPADRTFVLDTRQCRVLIFTSSDIPMTLLAYLLTVI
jgi:hypothetical protein